MSSLLIILGHAKIKVLLEFGLLQVLAVNCNCHIPSNLDVRLYIEHILEFIADYCRKLTTRLRALGFFLSLLLTWQGLEEW